MRYLALLVLLGIVATAAAFDVQFGADGLSLPSLDARIELMQPKAPGWQGALVAPGEKAFESLADGVLPYVLRERTGHSWTYGMGTGRLAVQPTASGSLVVSNVVSYSADLSLQVSCFRLRLSRNYRNPRTPMGWQAGNS